MTRLLLLPEQVDVLALQPVGHGAVHVVPTLVAGVGQIVEDGVTQAVLGDGQVLVALGILFQLLLGEVGDGLAVDGDHLVLLVEELDVLCLPLAVLDLAEEDESAVALDVDGDTLDREALRDRGLHLADAALLGQVDVGQRAVLSVHDEVAVRAALDRDGNEVFDRQATGPGCR